MAIPICKGVCNLYGWWGNYALLQVEGDTVTIIFEMKSGREHNTPDKAVWGFACTVRPQEVSTDDGCSSLPFIIDLSLAITSLSCSLISQLYDGPAVSTAEQECQALMISPLLQRYMCVCVYNGMNCIRMFLTSINLCILRGNVFRRYFDVFIQMCMGVNLGW